LSAAFSEIFIDFDETISPGYVNEDYKPLPPTQEVIDAVNRIQKDYTVVIYSCRSNPEVCDPQAELEMIMYLEKYGIKYDRIEINKPHYRVLICDKTINPKHGWNNILKELYVDLYPRLKRKLP